MSDYKIGIVGHRTNRIGDLIDEITPVLMSTVDGLALSASKIYDCVNFYVSYYNGTDRLAFKVLCSLKTIHPEYNIKITLVLPSRVNIITRRKGQQETINGMIAAADKVVYLDEVKTVYSKDFMEYVWERNTKFSKYIVDECSCLVAVWDGGDDSCTSNTLQYAVRKNKIIATITLTGELQVLTA